MSLIRIRYNATRFPRTIILPDHKKQVFQADKRELDFEEYDANLMLKNNVRLTPNTWEFSIVGVIEETKGQAPKKEAEIKAETPVLASKTEKEGKGSSKRGRSKK